MAASGNVPLELEIGDRNECPVAAGEDLYRGSMVFADAAGRATTTLGAIFLGHAAAEANNVNGGAGAINVLLHTGRYRAQVTLTGVALTDVGKWVWASDNNTLALTSNGGANALVGKVARYVDTNLAVVEFIPASDESPLDVPQDHIADTKADYVNTDLETTGDPDTTKIANALNTIAAKVNAILANGEAAGINASS